MDTENSDISIKHSRDNFSQLTVVRFLPVAATHECMHVLCPTKQVVVKGTSSSLTLSTQYNKKAPYLRLILNFFATLHRKITEMPLHHDSGNHDECDGDRSLDSEQTPHDNCPPPWGPVGFTKKLHPLSIMV